MCEQDDFCVVCTTQVFGYRPEFCCDGFECGCMGKPTKPCLCPDCEKKLFSPVLWTPFSPETMPEDGVEVLVKLYVDQNHSHGHNEYKEMMMHGGEFRSPDLTPPFPIKYLVGWQPITTTI